MLLLKSARGTFYCACISGWGKLYCVLHNLIDFHCQCIQFCLLLLLKKFAYSCKSCLLVNRRLVRQPLNCESIEFLPWVSRSREPDCFCVTLSDTRRICTAAPSQRRSLMSLCAGKTPCVKLLSLVIVNCSDTQLYSASHNIWLPGCMPRHH